ncbi:sensor histidine kinase, partial [Cupriavidus sp. 2MCAB6]|uniref:sensor histidine kinase n=1 Tax=Cupriavidus sp. 2MCAB6 TaxID=3232981 RepID=UPI003F929B46
GLADSTARMAALADRLLSMARAAHGGAETPRVLDLAALVREVCLELTPAARARRIDLGFEGEGALPVLGTDLLHELVTNLVDNALRYTPSDGVATARVHRAGEAVVLEVEDDGPGIPLQERAAVLEPFYRGKAAGLSAAGEANPGGSGLGLTIVRDIAAAHGATLALLEGEGGNGLLVRVRFPPA